MTSAALRIHLESSLAQRIPGALSPRLRHLPELLASGIPPVDTLLGGGIPRGGFTEISGPASTGRTALALSILARATQKNACAWVDVHDALDPESAAACGVDLSRLLWIRAGGPPPRHVRSRKEEKPWSRLDQALKATDLLLQAGGFTAIVLDMSDVAPQHALRVPLASWYRFRLAASQARCALILLSQAPCGKSSTSLALHCAPAPASCWNATAQSPLFEQAAYCVRMERRRGEELFSPAAKKSPQPSHALWTGETPWSR